MIVPEATFHGSSADTYTASEWAALQNAASQILEYPKVISLSTAFLISKSLC